MKRPLDTRILELVRTRALEQGGVLTGADVADAVRASGLVVGSGSASEVIRLLQEELTGLGPLQVHADSVAVTDVLVDEAGWVWTDGADGLTRQPDQLSPEDVIRLATRLFTSCGQRLDEAAPYGDVVVDHYRIHAVLPPIAAAPLLSIRVRRTTSARLDELVGDHDGWSAVLRALVTSRANFLISGGTGSGKTTLLSALLAEVGPAERLVICEDARELAPAHPHVIGMQTRPGNVEGAGSVGLSELVAESLRMRPDRLIVGECRGAEVRDFLAAMNTGHDGAGGTIHASGAEAVPARLLAMGALAGMSPESTAVQAASAIDYIVHLRAGAPRGPAQLAALDLDDTAGQARLRIRPLAVDEDGTLANVPGAEAALDALLGASAATPARRTPA
ncbi:CpaF family protein [Zhihengliuella flava]|nr:ATPase, T2SS/T4P/T4SS family [Zhihengliuella flava]